MKKNVRKEFIDEIRKSLPANTNAAIYLIGQLGLGKETVYRRLRGTIPFSLDEAAQVARELNISLDRLCGITGPKNGEYEFDINYFQDFNENYEQFMSGSLKIIDKIAQDPNGIYVMAANHLPFNLYSEYGALSDFRYRRWVYEREQGGSFSAEEFKKTTPEDNEKARQELTEAFRRVGSTYMILDANVFRALVKEISYFRVLSLITDDDVMNMRAELLVLLDRLERTMLQGETEHGAKISFYLSNFILDASYSYLESADSCFSFFHVYDVHQIMSVSPEICTVQKAWLQTILRHSTLITQSGEIERITYLKEQRAIVDAL